MASLVRMVHRPTTIKLSGIPLVPVAPNGGRQFARLHAQDAKLVIRTQANAEQRVQTESTGCRFEHEGRLLCRLLIIKDCVTSVAEEAKLLSYVANGIIFGRLNEN